ncbi:hypothetical protein D3C72_2255570 [compost metagenome]
MRTSFVVVVPPFLDEIASVPQALELVVIEALVPKLPVEAFDEGVLDRLPRRNEPQADLVVVGPAVERF